jgi:hypothetical protein
MAKDDKKIDEVDGIPREREGTRPDFSVPPPRKKLPKDMQATLDNDEKMWEIMYDGRYVHTIPRSTSPQPHIHKQQFNSQANGNVGAKTPQTPTSATPPTPPASVPS